jgi:four helix bundle protein
MTAQYSYHKLIVYQKAKELVIFVYKVEGYIKSSTKEFIRFMNISLGSLAELDFHIDLSFDLGYLNQQILDEYLWRSLEVTKLLRSFQKSLRAKL